MNTIFLILGDLKREKIINNNLKSEILLLETQANRCKEILFNLSKNPQKLKDTFLQQTTTSNLIDLNIEKFFNNKKNKIKIKIFKEKNEPLINYSDEIMYGLGNIIQNATEHARNIIDVNILWNMNNIFIYIKDDGKGFPNEILERIGNPYISNKNNENSMGLGIFIAKNLIENIGGQILFTNNSKSNGSTVEIQLKRKPKMLPVLEFKSKNISSYNLNDFILLNYDYHPILKAKMNV